VFTFTIQIPKLGTTPSVLNKRVFNSFLKYPQNARKQATDPVGLVHQTTYHSAPITQPSPSPCCHGSIYLPFGVVKW